MGRPLLQLPFDASPTPALRLRNDTKEYKIRKNVCLCHVVWHDKRRFIPEIRPCPEHRIVMEAMSLYIN